MQVNADRLCVEVVRLAAGSITLVLARRVSVPFAPGPAGCAAAGRQLLTGFLLPGNLRR
ncbi:hypothetical protein SAMN05428939_0217 [Streptomyces sp. TLI_105]|nr:hypothetical protein SAMN05428939_0217 [Streptomyces sp. TLI_105]